MLTKVLIANRGAIACRIIRTLKQLQIASVAVYSEADAHSLHVRMADEAIALGGTAASDSYLCIDKILAAAQQTGAQAIHAGYGFLSENADFADACAQANLIFIGPTPAQMRAFGLKHTARALAKAHDVPLLAGTGLLANVDEALDAAQAIGYPVMLKSTAGGGGIGMRLVWQTEELIEAYASVTRLASANFKEAGIYLEKYVADARHIEVQIFGDGQGQVIALGERDCSVQRRNQKVIEETPAPHLDETTRQALLATAVRLAKAVNYQSAGTVEFVYDCRDNQFYFLEMNTRLQVEHGITEEVCQIDLVAWMILLAAGQLPPLESLRVQAQGTSIQVRVYAEDPNQNFQPSAGLLSHVAWPTNCRVETWLESGSEVPPFYDPMLAKIIVHAPTRSEALQQLQDALQHTRLAGIETNLAYLKQILADNTFIAGQQTTRYLTQFTYQPRTLDVLEAGLQTTVQDYPARLGYWSVGVPPSGPMDDLSFRIANELVGNLACAAGLECTITAPTLRFNCDSVFAVTGAPTTVWVDEQAVPMWQALTIRAGSVLKIGAAQDTGSRIYLAIQGGIDVPRYLGSRSTFTLGQFGGHAGRCLALGDVLTIGHDHSSSDNKSALAHADIPQFGHHWQIGVLYGPHGAPDFFTTEDITQFFNTDWQVHYNSSRTGVRLIGPKPQWARRDGGEAGLHPSNIHDNAYAIGAIDFTGDMPVILGPDGPSLGGFVCPAVVVSAELWKLGQLRAGDTIRFIPIDYAQAETLKQQQIAALTDIYTAYHSSLHACALASPILFELAAEVDKVKVVYRQAGDEYLLIEYGDLVLDIALRLRVHALVSWIEAQAWTGIIDLTPGIRSLQIHFDSQQLSRATLLAHLKQAEAELDDSSDIAVPSRIIHLPLSWDDSSTQLAIEKYMQSVRKDAPWCPSNIEFIRRINGLDHIEQVKDIVFSAHYLVMGLGDVYLGAPVATPIDPRHRLVTTKYNPARTWTPENAVGIGGAYLCVYGMEGPGGYQFVGRTLQMWNRYRQTDLFSADKPWLLRFFDQIRFYPVSHDQLQDIRRDFPLGNYPLKIEHTVFKLSDYQQFLKTNAESIQQHKQQQQSAFDAEYERWLATGQAHYEEQAQTQLSSHNAQERPADAISVYNKVAGNVWQVLVNTGDKVNKGDALVIIESMKMEFTVYAPCDAKVFAIHCQTGHTVMVGYELVTLVEDSVL
ncbi:urea carboxylase [Agitococcus lubricus]|uniref:Biotin carboxylase n=1 Tax=Agitococcus lubricus TaxID=1077255 RepID=A0A2T5J2B2_9GAMM|nr:urea carboxylase [Agitococcus lubricus]PTQ90658.1 urea carboxylase [Agitococcus lubricus]